MEPRALKSTEIALKALFNSFSYKFRGKYYHQQSLRARGAAAQLEIEEWASKYMKILVESSLKIKMMAGYMNGLKAASNLPWVHIRA